MRFFLAAPLLFVSACSQLPRIPAPQPTHADWRAIVVSAASLAERDQFDEADSVLVRFAREHPGARPAFEVPFWRALYKLDPRNTGAKPGEGLEIIEAYLDSPIASWYKPEASVLRYLATQIETLRGALPPAPIVAGDSTPAGLAARDIEIRNLRAELARVNAELERIKRRLASPNP